MTELNFKGKEFVYNHHLAVPFRPLVPVEMKPKVSAPSLWTATWSSKATTSTRSRPILPLYAGKVDCIFRSLRDLCGPWLGIGSCEHGARCFVV